MITYNFPIIIAEGLDVKFFSSLEAATEYIEVVGVNDGVYKAYDALGNNDQVVEKMLSMRIKGRVKIGVKRSGSKDRGQVLPFAQRF